MGVELSERGFCFVLILVWVFFFNLFFFFLLDEGYFHLFVY